MCKIVNKAHKDMNSLIFLTIRKEWINIFSKIKRLNKIKGINIQALLVYQELQKGFFLKTRLMFKFMKYLRYFINSTMGITYMKTPEQYFLSRLEIVKDARKEILR